MDFSTGANRPKPARLIAACAFFSGVLALASVITGCGSAPHRSDGDSASEGSDGKSGSAALRVRSKDEIAPGYEIKLSCLEDQNLNGKYRVEFTGKLKLPYDVVIETDTLTREALKARVIDSYAKFFKTTPKIGVSVSDEKYWIDVRGLVEKPARFLVQRNTSLDEALSQAGGLQKSATVKYVKIQQGEGSMTVKLSDYYSGNTQDKIPPWQGGDILFFQSDRDYAETAADSEKAYIQLLGEVRNPGEYRFQKKSDFYDYLARAGGPTDKANLLRIEVIRNTPEGKVSNRFELGDPRDVPPLKAGDLVLVHSDKQTPSERVVAMAAGIAGILNTMLLIILLF